MTNSNQYMKWIPVLAIVIAGLFWWQLEPKQSPEKRIDRPKPITQLKTQIDLPGEDGRVYIIESPADDFGFEIHTCMIHVKANASAISCTPQKVSIPITHGQ